MKYTLILTLALLCIGTGAWRLQAQSQNASPTASEGAEETMAAAQLPAASPAQSDGNSLESRLITIIDTRLKELEERLKNPTTAPVLSFEMLEALNKNIDQENPGFQPYYIAGRFLADAGTYFAVTNLSSDALSASEASLGSLEVDGGVAAENISAEEMQINRLVLGSASDPKGITLYDQSTQAAFCLKIDNGALLASADGC